MRKYSLLLGWNVLRRGGNLNLDMVPIDPGRPWQGGTTERFQGKFCDECLSMEWFRNHVVSVQRDHLS